MLAPFGRVLDAEDAAIENARASAEALVAGKSDEAAEHCGKLLTFDLPQEMWVDAHFALLCMRPTDLNALLSRVPRRAWMEKEDLSRMTDLVQRVNHDAEGGAKILDERLAKTPDDPVLLNLLGRALEGLKKPEEATATYEKARKAAGKAICFWINFPQVSLAERLREQKPDEAYLLDREVITWLAEPPDPRVPLAKGDLAEGLRVLRDLAYYRTQLAMALSNAGYYLAQKGKSAEAIDLDRKSLAIEPRDPHTWGNLAVAQYAVEDAAGALRSIDQALRYAPEDDILKKERQIIVAKLQEGK